MLAVRARRQRTASGRAYHVSTVRAATPSHANPLVLGHPESWELHLRAPTTLRATRPCRGLTLQPPLTNSFRRTNGHAADRELYESIDPGVDLLQVVVGDRVVRPCVRTHATDDMSAYRAFGVTGLAPA